MFSMSILVFSLIVLISCILLRLLFIKLGWTDIYNKLHEQFVNGFAKPAPFIYFMAIIVFCGGIGIWVSFYQKTYDVSNITTYVFALLSSLMVDLIIIKDNDDNKSKYDDKDIIMFIIGAFIFTLSISVTATILGKEFTQLKWFMSCVSLLCTWYLWWILSSCDSKFGLTQKKLRMATIGGEPTDDVYGGGLEDLRR